MNTRDAVQKYLEDHPFSYADEISQVLFTTRANIQYHLKRLEADGIIAQVRQPKETLERGRPRALYALAVHQKPDNLPGLGGALLDLYLRDQPGEEIITGHLVALAHALLPSKAPPSSSTARLNRLARDLSERGYQARWEAHAGGPEIIFRNCPYAALIAQHPELCQMDAQLLKIHLGTAVRQTQKIQLPTTPVCRFIIEPTKGKSS